MKSPDVIFIIIDTLRKDYSFILENELKKFGFISYDNVISTATWTLPSHTSIFTGLYPLYHGTHENEKNKNFSGNLLTRNLLTNNLTKFGYKNYLLTANIWLIGFIKEFKLEKEFEKIYLALKFDDYLNKKNNYLKQLIKYLKFKNIKLEEITKFFAEIKNFLFIKNLFKNRNIFISFKLLILSLTMKILDFILSKSSIAQGWPKEKGSLNIINEMKKIILLNENKFIFINFLEVHERYLVQLLLPFTTFYNLYFRMIKKEYKNQVIYITKKIIKLIELLKKYKKFDNSLIIITSDHGQLLGEYNKLGHRIGLYDELLRIPLFIKYPKKYKVKINKYKNKYISLVDFKKFILNGIINREFDDKYLYSDYVFAENYYKGYKIAIYYKNCKGIFNVEKFEFEKIIFYDSNEFEKEKIKKEMEEKIINFLKNKIKILQLK